MKKTLFVLVLAIVIVLVITGCGGGNSTDPVSSEESTKPTTSVAEQESSDSPELTDPEVSDPEDKDDLGPTEITDLKDWAESKNMTFYLIEDGSIELSDNSIELRLMFNSHGLLQVFLGDDLVTEVWTSIEFDEVEDTVYGIKSDWEAAFEAAASVGK